MHMQATEQEFRRFLRRQLSPEDFQAVASVCPEDMRSSFAFCDTGAVTYSLMPPAWQERLTERQRQAFERAFAVLAAHADGRILNSIRVFCGH